MSDRASETDDRSISLKTHTRIVTVLVALCSVSIGVAIGAILRPAANATVDDNRLSISSATTTTDSMSALFSKVARRVEPAVVHIQVSIGEAFTREGAGSGVIVSSGGYIITNEHVISRASRIRVKLYDGKEFSAAIVGSDSLTDLAVLKIDSREALPAAVMGDSDRLNVGDWVLAIGSPFGLEQTVTAGIISAKDRLADPRNQTAFQQFLQTDAAINPGNSGGPLVNLAGEVVGINSQILTNSGFYNGLGFALPSTAAVEIYNQIIANGRVRRAFLGIDLEWELTPQIASLNKLADVQGALVKNVTDENSPAAKAGIQSGDVIVAINGQKVKDRRDLIRRVGSLPVGTQATIEFVRNGVRRSVTVKLEERRDASQVQPQVQPNSSEPKKSRPPESKEQDGAKEKSGLGIAVGTLSKEIAASLGLDGARGAYVTRVEPSSPAANEIIKYDVIVEINYRPVDSREDFQQIISALRSGDPVVLRVLRRGRYPLRSYIRVSLTMP